MLRKINPERWAHVTGDILPEEDGRFHLGRASYSFAGINTDTITVAASGTSGYPINQTTRYPVGIYGYIGTAITSGTETMRCIRARLQIDKSVTSTASVYATQSYLMVSAASVELGGSSGACFFGAWNSLQTSGATLVINAWAGATLNYVSAATGWTLGVNGILTGNFIASALHDTNTINGILAGIYIYTYSGKEKWDSGIYIEADATDTAISIKQCDRALMIGEFSEASNIVVTGTGTVNNYPMGVFAKVTADCAPTADIRCAWFRLRVNTTVQVGTVANWGSALRGLQGSLKFYGGTATGTFCWCNAGVFGSLETDGATKVHFKEGSVSAPLFAHVGLLATTSDDVDIESGAVVAGVAINSGSATNVTNDGIFAGLYIYKDVAAGKNFADGIHIASACCDIGITVPLNAVLAKFISVGTWNNWCEWDQADEFVELLVETTAKNGTKPLVRFRLAGDADEAAVSGRLCALQLQTYNQGTNNIFEMRTLEIQSGIKDDATLETNGVFQGVFICLEDLDSIFTGTGHVYWIELRSQFFNPSSAFNGESSFIHINNMNDAAAAVNSVIRLNDADGAGQAGVATYFLDIENQVLPFLDTHTHDSDTYELQCIVNGTPCYLKLYT